MRLVCHRLGELACRQGIKTNRLLYLRVVEFLVVLWTQRVVNKARHHGSPTERGLLGRCLFDAALVLLSEEGLILRLLSVSYDIRRCF